MDNQDAGRQMKTGKFRIRKWIIVIIVIIAAAAAVIIIGEVHSLSKSISSVERVAQQEVHDMTNSNLSEPTVQGMRGRWTIALFGLDGRSKKIENANSDVIMIVSIDNDSGAIKIASVYRDTCFKIKKSFRKVNSAYAEGGPAEAVSVLNQNLDLQIDDYIAVNWKTVADAVNILGGTDIDVTSQQMKWINGYITETVKSTGIGTMQLTHSGLQHLDGVQTVAYCRIRYDVDDFGRTQKQRDVLQQLMDKAKSANFSVLNNLIETVFPETASSIDTDKLIEMGKTIGKYSIASTAGFPGTKFCKTVSGNDFVFADGFAENVSALHDFLYGTDGYTPSTAVQTSGKEIDDHAGDRSGRDYINNTADEIEQKLKSKSGYQATDTSETTGYRETEPVTETAAEQTKNDAADSAAETLTTETGESASTESSTTATNAAITVATTEEQGPGVTKESVTKESDTKGSVTKEPEPQTQSASAETSAGN